MANNLSPVCPTSFNQPRGLSTQFAFGLAQEIAAIPKAVDVKSAITILNTMTSIIRRLTTSEPQINNIGQKPDYSMIVTTVDPNPASNWREGYRSYTDNKVVNPDDPSLFIPIKTVASVDWYDNWGHSITYRNQ